MIKKTKEKMVARFPEPEDQAKAEALADISLRSAANGAAVMVEFGKAFGEQDIGALAIALHEVEQKVLDGDMRRCEAMLLGQAHALQSIFVSLSRRAVKQEYVKNYETFLRLALKAQSQCRATLETLAEIKNPRPLAFVKQANIAHGPQQVNNGPTGTRAQETENRQTQLLETNHGERMDTGKTSKAGRADPAMATVGKIDGAEDRGG